MVQKVWVMWNRIQRLLLYLPSFCNTSYDDGVGVFTCRFNIDIAGVNHTLYYMEITRDWDKVMRLQGADKVLEGKFFEVKYDLSDPFVRTARPLDYDSIYDVY